MNGILNQNRAGFVNEEKGARYFVQEQKDRKKVLKQGEKPRKYVFYSKKMRFLTKITLFFFGGMKKTT